MKRANRFPRRGRRENSTLDLSRAVDAGKLNARPLSRIGLMDFPAHGRERHHSADRG
jgi:hypothetical protein